MTITLVRPEHRHTCDVCGVNLRCNDSQCKNPASPTTWNCGVHSAAEVAQRHPSPASPQWETATPGCDGPDY